MFREGFQQDETDRAHLLMAIIPDSVATNNRQLGCSRLCRENTVLSDALLDNGDVRGLVDGGRPLPHGRDEFQFKLCIPMQASVVAWLQ